MRYFTELYFVKQLFGEGLIFNIMKYAPLVMLCIFVIILLLLLVVIGVCKLKDCKRKKQLDKSYTNYKRKKEGD